MPVTRPKSSDSADQRRYDYRRRIDDESRLIPHTSDSIEAICDLDPVWVIEHLRQDRVTAIEKQDPRHWELGCWMCKAEEEGQRGYYSKINLRNTYYPRNKIRKIGFSLYRHQLAAVAAREGNFLVRTSKYGGTDEVSHLCLNTRYFNPDHMIIESKELNRKRWGCVGAWVTRQASDGTIYHPCPHGTEERKEVCLLPKRYLQEKGWYQMELRDSGSCVR